MSCLLLKTSGNLQKEVVKATHEEFFCEKTYGGSSCWPASDQPSRVVHADCSEGGSWEESAVGFVGLQRGIWSSEEEEEEEDLQSGIFASKKLYQKESKALENSNVCQREQQQAWEEYVVDELVCKLISQLHFPPEPSAFCSEKGELQELDHQEGDIGVGKTSACSADAEISKISTPVCVEDSKEPLPISLAEPEVSNGGCHREPVELRSALRGGYVKSGLGHRPQLHVTWAPDVYDPPCTSTSHTSNQSRRKHHHHHHPKGDHKNRHKGKGSSHSDSQKKSQKKLLRRLKHAGEAFSSGSIGFSQRGQQSSAVRYITPALDDLTLKSSRVGPLISLPKAGFLSPVLSLGECELITFDKIQGCHPRHVVPTHKLFV